MKLAPSLKLFRFFPFRPGVLPSDDLHSTTPALPPEQCFDNVTATCFPTNATTSLPPLPEPEYTTEDPFITNAERIGYLYIMPIICVAGIVLNSLTILVLFRKSFRAATYTYLIALACADIWTAVFTLPIGTIR